MVNDLPAAKVVSKLVSNGEQDTFDTYRVNSYNLGVLGNSLAVGQRTLDPPGKVRILLPQPAKVI